MTGPTLRELLPAGALHRLACTGSTNDDARRLAAAGAPEGTVVVAERQTSGRGRHGRTWDSPAGGVYVSVVLGPGGGAEEAVRFTLAAAVAACRAAREVGAAEVEIKWPNDLLWRGRKVAGILAELRTTGGRVEDLVVGAGFNVHQEEGDFPVALAGRAASLRQAAGRPVDGERVLTLHVRHLLEGARLLREGGFDEVRRAWSSLAPGSRGRRVRVLGAGGPDPLEAVTDGIDPTGALRVRLPGGEVRALTLAESVVSWGA